MSVYYYLGNVYILYLRSHISLILGVVSLEFYKLQQLGFYSATGTSIASWPFVCLLKL